MATRILQTLADELHAWRVTLTKLRDERGLEVDELIGHIDAALESVATLQANDEIDMVAN